MAVIIDNTNSGVEVDLPDTFNGNNDNGNDRDAEAASTSYEEDTFSISSADGGKSWRSWDRINRMNIFMMLFVVILLVLTAGLSATAAKSKSNVVGNMSSTTKASKAPTAKSTKAPTCVGSGKFCATSADCCAGLFCDTIIDACLVPSDRRLKHEITLIGRSPSNIPIYTFKYRSGMQLANNEVLDIKSTFVGAMAQD
ncbi:hypothetical protein ACHAWC_007059, partial [Mediolabrus comicus]